jgi:Tol biopolymer transport system component
MGREVRGLGILAAAVVTAAAFAGEPAKKEEPAPLKIVPATEDEKKAWLEKETPEQKKLRAELAAVKGSRIAFNANLGEKNASVIFMMNPDGSDLKRLTAEGVSECYPHLSFDGKRLLFERSESLSAEEQKKIPCDATFPFNKEGRALAGKPAGYIWVSDLDGGNARRLCQGCHPHWAPNGKAFAYMLNQLYGRVHKAALFDMEKNVEKAILPTERVAQCFPCFSPDGKWLLLSNGDKCPYVPMNEGCTDKAAEGKMSMSPIREGCNGELSPDGQWITWVVDTAGNLGGWLCYAKFDPTGGKVQGQNLNLGVDKNSVNYFPDFSPDSKYLVYVHAEQQKGVKSWTLTSQQDVYVCRFPADGTSVRITWTNAACQHPNWRNVGKVP